MPSRIGRVGSAPPKEAVRRIPKLEFDSPIQLDGPTAATGEYFSKVWVRYICGSDNGPRLWKRDRKSTRLNSSHGYISYAVFCLKKKQIPTTISVTQMSSSPSATELFSLRRAAA